ncbi:uracil nucleotide/cysteinyl leukotriene receptor [Aplochiton taeniatus]
MGRPIPHQENLLFAMFYIIVFIMAVPCNIIALWAFFRQSTSPSKIFLRQLAIADMSFVLILPLRIVYHLSDSHWPCGLILCRLVGFFFYVNVYCSLYFITFISLDRLLALALPLRSLALRKPAYARVTSGILWVVVMVSMSPLLFSKKSVIVHCNNATSILCTQLYLENTSPTALVSTVVAFTIPLTSIIGSYILILHKLRGVKQRKERPVKDKAIGMIILVMVNFLVAFVPYHVNRIIYIYMHWQGHLTTVSIETLARTNRITSALTCLSGVLDPLMYFFLANAYRHLVIRIFCKNREDDQQANT